MNGFWKSLIVAFVLMHASHGVYLAGLANPQNLASLLFRSRMASQDPAVTMACFSDYMTKSNDVSEGYSAKYNKCFVDAKDGRKTIEEEMAGERVIIAESSRNICESMESCNGLNTTLALFNCHAEIGANNTKAVYGISGNASEYASIMQEKYRLIDMRHEQCCKSAERKYVEETAMVYRALQDCLEGRAAPTTAGPPTTTAAPTTTTPIPTTTTTTTTAPTTTTTTTTTPAPTTTAPPPTTTTTTVKPITSDPTEIPLEPSAMPIEVAPKFDTEKLAAQILNFFK